jgi:RNA polymerase sigma-70 factor (ECF subfamily)
MHETLELTFVAALQCVPPRQRAVFLLCDVARFSVCETADMVGMRVASVDRLLGQARSTLVARLCGR